MPILAIEDPRYQPAMRIISAFTNANPAVITTSFDHDYITGTIVRLKIPDGYGILQANNLEGTITVTGNTTFTIDIDSTGFDVFAVPATFPDSYQHPQVVPTGEINSILTAATDNIGN